MSLKSKCRTLWLSLLWVFLIALACLPSFAEQSRRSDKDIRLAWYVWEPYLTETVKNGVVHYTGLDYVLVKEIVESYGYNLVVLPMEWSEQTEKFTKGEVDLSPGATYTEERAVYSHFTKPYRYEKIVVFMRGDLVEQFAWQNFDDILRDVQQSKLRLGVGDGYAYGIDALDKITLSGELLDGLVKAPGEEDLFKLLGEGKIDALIATQLIGHAVSWKLGMEDFVAEYPLLLVKNPVHIMLSKASISEEILSDINQAIDDIHNDGRFEKLVRHFLMPVVLSFTVDQPWFMMIDILGTIAFAISGLILARRENYDIFGAFVLAALPAIGGGVVRDIVVDRRPIGVLQDPLYIYCIAGTVLGGFIVIRIGRFLKKHFMKPTQNKKLNQSILANNAVEISDALGLAAFTISGVIIAVSKQAEPLWVWGPILATLTGAGGGIIRDVVRADAGNPFLKGAFYPEIAFAWGFILSVFIVYESSQPDVATITYAVWFTLVGTFMCRMAAVYWKLRSPLF